MGDQGPLGLVCKTFNKVKPYLAMVSLQVGFAGMYIVTMLCLNRGLSHYVLVVYRHAVATIAVAPFAFVFERKIRPKLTLPIFLRITALGLIEPVIDQNLYYVGMKYTSASFSSAIFNILPAVTFIMAVIFRLEKLKIKSLRSQAKIVGTIVTLGGAMLMTLYKGPILEMVWTKGRAHHATATTASDQHWLLGTAMLVASVSGWAGFFILQSFTLEMYPAELSMATLICFMGTVQGAAVALVMERDFSAWAFGLDSRLLAPLYTGVINSAVAYYVTGVVIKERGPVFVTAFNPLCMIIVAALGSLVLAEQIHLGSVIGAIVIVTGLYSVIWGKSKDPIGLAASTTDEEGSGLELPISATIEGEKTNPNGGTAITDIPTKISISKK